MNLAQTIRETHVQTGSLAIFWLAQAGFVFKTPAGKVIYIDPYLTDSVHRQLGHLFHGFKRMALPPLAAEEVAADVLVCTHSHEDHLDVDLIPVVARHQRTRFVGAPDCAPKFAALGLPAERYTILHKDETLDLGDVRLTGVYADHGELAPDALGVLLQAGDITVWQVGDTAYRPDRWQAVFRQGVDVILPPINGAFGNLNATEAARLAGDASAKVAIPCHFWMFVEHGGDPAEFLAACQTHAPQARPMLLSPGELFVYARGR